MKMILTGTTLSTASVSFNSTHYSTERPLLAQNKIGSTLASLLPTVILCFRKLTSYPLCVMFQLHFASQRDVDGSRLSEGMFATYYNNFKVLLFLNGG